jgi:cellobiose-specific phosphotransferase system component IIA
MNDEEEKPNSLESILNSSGEIIPETPVVEIMEEQEDDFEFVRQNIRDTITKGGLMMNELIEICQQSGHPRAFEVASQHFKNLVEANRQLLEAKRTNVQMIREQAKGGRAEITNQNLFVGTTAELARMLKDMKENKNGESVD